MYSTLSYNDKIANPSLDIKQNNIGDSIQSLAIKRLLGCESDIQESSLLWKLNTKRIIPINGYVGTGITRHIRNNKNIIPIYISTHFWNIDENTKKDDICIDDNSKIGCRDWYTYDILTKLGFDAYISFCVTLTFDKRDNAKQYNTIYLNEVDHFNSYISRIIDGQNIKYISNYIPLQDYTWEQLEYIAQERLDELRDNAKLVITRRLHTYFPCIAMGIPCIYLGPIDKRTQNIIDIVNLNTIDILKPMIIDNFKYHVLNVGEDKSNELMNFYKLMKECKRI